LPNNAITFFLLTMYDKRVPQIRMYPICKKVLQANEIHKCPDSISKYEICEKCGKKYNRSQPHICPTIIWNPLCLQKW